MAARRSRRKFKAVDVKVNITGLNALSPATIRVGVADTVKMLGAVSQIYWFATYNEWSFANRPDNVYQQRNSTKQYRVRTGRKGNIYRLVSLGSPSHPIDARNWDYMYFNQGYSAATAPNVLQSKEAFYFGPRMRAKHVEHPGFPGRRFDLQVAEAMGDWITKNYRELKKPLQRAIDEAAASTSSSNTSSSSLT